MINKHDEYGYTIMMRTAVRRKSDMIIPLSQNGADSTVTVTSNTALDIALM